MNLVNESYLEQIARLDHGKSLVQVWYRQNLKFGIGDSVFYSDHPNVYRVTGINYPDKNTLSEWWGTYQIASESGKLKFDIIPESSLRSAE